MTTDTLELPEQARSAKNVMMAAHALCPTDMPHPERMRWMADYFMKHFGFAYATAAVLAERERCARIAESRMDLAERESGPEAAGHLEFVASAIRNKE